MEPHIAYSLLKALHLFFMVGYFAALFHLVRLFVAHREALREWEPERGILTERFTAMERGTLYTVAWPALLLLTAFGVWMLWQRPALLKEPFMHAKLGLVALLIGYHLWAQNIGGRLARGELAWSSLQLRVWAQGPTFFLFALLVLVLLRDQLRWWGGVLGLITIGGVVAYAIASMRKPKDEGVTENRERQPTDAGDRNTGA